MKNKICFVTTSRSDYGFIEELLNEASLKLKKKFKIFLIISGSHLSKFFGYTIKNIKKYKNIKIFKVKINDIKDSKESIIKNLSNSCLKFSRVLKIIKPDLLVTFGDRFEMFSISVTAYTLNIKQAHIAGGEVTSGSIDEGFRHAMTKFSNLHFPVTENYKKRLIRMGENPNSVFNYGSLGVDKIKKINFFTKKEIEKKIKIKFLKKNFIVVFHPETAYPEKTIKNFKNLIGAINYFNNANFIFTAPSSDYLGKKFINLIKKTLKEDKNKNKFFFKSLGSKLYLSLLKNSNGLIGNSSSGISEAPILKVYTLNIGDRQNGRVKLKSVIDCSCKKNEIILNIKKILNKKKFQNDFNPYGNGKTASKIIKKIFSIKKFSSTKNFYDLK